MASSPIDSRRKRADVDGPVRRSYQPPQVISEEKFEILALACNTAPGQNGWCDQGAYYAS